MNYEIFLEPKFLKEMKRLAKKYRSFKDDLNRLEADLLANPFIGVDLGGGVRKVRMAIASKNRGKSHGARVITYTCVVDEVRGTIHLLDIYDKQVQESISTSEVEQLVAEVKAKIAQEK